MARRQFVVFKVGDEEFAMDIMLTKEILASAEITPVPEAYDYVEGVINLRGTLIPVLDLNRRLRAGSNARGGDPRIVVVNIDGRVTGLTVDGVTEVIRVSDDQVEPPPDLIVEAGATYIQGVARIGSRFVTLIDVAATLTEEVSTELEKVLVLLAKARPEERTPANVG